MHSINHRQVRAAMSLTAAACGAMLIALCGCKKEEPKTAAGDAQGPPVVQVASATQKDVPIVGNWVATTDGFVNAQIQPQVSGYLIRQDYTEGSRVQKGQVLFEIDPRTFQASLDQANGQLAQAQAQLDLATINVTRDTPLAEARAISQSTLDNDLQTQAANLAAVQSAQATVHTAEINLAFTKVRSLIDGVAGQAALQVGSLVNTTSVLTSVSQLNPIKVYFSISEQEYLNLAARAKSGGKKELLKGGSLIPLTLTLADSQVYGSSGHIIFVDRSVSAQTGSLRIAASFPNPGNLLRPGQFGRVGATTNIVRNAVLVPQRAVNELQGAQQVDIVGPDDVVHIRTVAMGAQAGNDVVITNGVQAGDHVVVEGNDKVKDGMKVAPQAAPASSNATANTAASKKSGGV